VTVSKGGKAIGINLYGPVSSNAVGAQIYGTASNTAVGSGWEDQIFAGGFAKSTTILNGGTEYLFGGQSTGAIVDSGGAEGGAGLQISTTVYTHGQQFLYSGGVSSNSRIRTGGQEQVFAGGKSIATTVFSGGIENVNSGGTAKDTVISGGTVNLLVGAKTAGEITFAASRSELVISGTKMPTAEITGFAPGDKIQFKNIKYSKNENVSVTNGEVTINDGKKHYTLKIAGAEAGENNYVFGSGSVLTETASPSMTFLHPAPTAAAQTALPPPVTAAAALSSPHVTSSPPPALLTADLTKHAEHDVLMVLSAHASLLA